MKKETLERITQFDPAWDKRNTDPKKDYGIHSVQVRMVLKGKKGAVHFVFSTGMLLPSTMREYIKNGRAKYEFITPNTEWYLNKPMGYDVGYHTTKKQWENQEINWPQKMIPKKKDGKDVAMDFKDPKTFPTWRKIGKKPPICAWLGKPCYCDGSAMRAETYMTTLLEKGSDAIWKLLEADYKDLK